jgi:TolB-like protein/DNA-binding winged helix-turn-helix (wHTH) protein/tetratricopeptide (TPR) repeat protein
LTQLIWVWRDVTPATLASPERRLKFSEIWLDASRWLEVAMLDHMSEAMRFDGFEIMPARRRLKGPLGDIDLRAKSFDVLLHLINSAGRVVPKNELLDAIWPDVTVTDESLERCVSDIRAALADDQRKILKTVSRRGYLFAAEVIKQSDAPSKAEDTQRTYRRSWWAVSIALLALIAGFGIKNWGQNANEGMPLVAVLPLVNVARDSKQDYFSDGLTEDLSQALARFKSIGVVASTSSSKFKGSDVPLSEIGKKLGARFLLTGNWRQSTDKIVLSLQLADTQSGAQVWSGQYDGDPKGFVGAKADLVDTIASSLDAHITKAELDRVSRKPSQDMSTYDLVLQGNALIRNTHVENRGDAIANARRLYETAAASDARYADAVEGIANTYLMAWLEPSPSSPTNEEFQSPNALKWAGDYARKAVELDETSASARATLGWILYWQNGPAEGLPSFDRALELNPGLADWRYGLLLSHGGRAKDAETYMKRIMLIDPLYPPRYKYLLGKAYYFQGRYDEALPLIKQAAVEMPSHRPSHVLLAAVTAEKGMKSELSSLVQDVFKLDPKFSISGWLRYLRISDKDYAARLRSGLLAAGLPE